MSRARLPIFTGTPFFSSSLSVTWRRKGPNEATPPRGLDALIGELCVSSCSTRERGCTAASEASGSARPFFPLTIVELVLMNFSSLLSVDCTCDQVDHTCNQLSSVIG